MLSAQFFKRQLFINGQWVEATGGATFETRNPATGSVITTVSDGCAEDIDRAVRAARECLNGPLWGYASTGAQRAVVLRK